VPAPHGRDLIATRERLARWFAGALEGASDVRLSELSGPGATGFSSDTLLFDVHWREGGQERTRGFVARLQPAGFQVFPEYDVARQFRIQRCLAETAIPVPAMFRLEEDPGLLGTPFYVMERIEGRIPTDNPPYHVGGWLRDVSPESRAAIWWSGLEVLGRIHQLDWKACGLDFVAPEREPGARPTPLERQLDEYSAFLDWATQDRGHVAHRGLDWLRTHRPREPEPLALCWGDSRIGNMAFHDDRCVAVFDWEMATLGNPEQDLAWWLFLDRHHSEGLGAPRLPGFPSREETLARWESLCGLRARHLDYYELFAAFRFAVIMIRVAQQMIHYGVLPPDSALERDNIVTRLLEKLLAEQGG
jgi:aminoglycoside phosphotransferase (APT) family kinase protein